MTVTQEHLEQWRALADAATPGPWRGDTDRGELKYAVLGGDRELVIKVDHKNAESGFVGDNGENDGAFVLAARTAVPALLAEVERLRAENAELHSENEMLRVLLEIPRRDAPLDAPSSQPC